LKAGWLDKWKNKKDVTLVKRYKEKVLDRNYRYAVTAIGNDIKKEDLKPKLNIPVFEKDYIAVGVGASDKQKITFPEKLAEFLATITSDYPEMKFHILGYGENDIQYFEKMKKSFGTDKNFICLVNKLNLLETTEQIANAKMYIGFDSGLYNIAYALGKKQICMISTKRGQEFHHDDENISFIYKELNEEAVEITDESKYNSDISSISPKVFKKAFNLLINRDIRSGS
jgi:ADP-heptose:LPS heptosyltransferase